jgi:uncharacterized membrane protein YeaQ/YmgE (transglycosylase-associated protein family)
MSVLGILLLVLLAYVAFNTVWGLAGLILALLIWALIGYIAGQIARGHGFGPLGNVLVGLAGGITGNLVLGMLGLRGLTNLPLGGIIVGVIGALLIIALADFINQSGTKRKRAL